MHIAGTNFQFGRSCTDYSYYFSRYPLFGDGQLGVEHGKILTLR
ncbi:MAG: hypothetical protein N4J56_006596 [Chroococcidiopsis sp. SAG 2025]|nr:hypothetical protein [Chroococcidiopsis sp. SAG 2025]